MMLTTSITCTRFFLCFPCYDSPKSGYDVFSSFNCGVGDGNKICYAYQRGECDRGSNCRFSHGDYFYAYGQGGAGRRTKKKEICYAYQNGACDRGDLCRFEHEYGEIPERRNGVKICYAFVKGNCEYGAACKFSHEIDMNIEACPPVDPPINEQKNEDNLQSTSADQSRPSITEG